MYTHPLTAFNHGLNFIIYIYCMRMRYLARALAEFGTAILHRISGPLSFVFPVTAAHAH